MNALATATATPRSPRSAQVNLALTILIVLLIAILAAHVASTPPPQIAEFNPSQQQIKEAPPNQQPNIGGAGNGQGAGPGGNGGGGASPSPLTTIISQLGGTVTNKVKHCIRARQTEDPQSPPCVNFFGGDNGGATSPGVTKDTITVAMPFFFGNTTLDQAQIDMEKYFNSRYEFYGRQLKFVGYQPSSSTHGRSGEIITPTEDLPDPQGEVADAQKVAGLHPFADVGYLDETGDPSVFIQQMATNKILYTTSDALVLTDADYAKYHPYAWNYYPAMNTLEKNLAAWVCSRLKPYPAQWANADIVGRPRKFGIIVGVFPDGHRPEIGDLTSGLSACGMTQNGSGPSGYPVSNIVYDSGDQSFTNSVANFNSPTDRVTSVICICAGGVQNDNILHRWVIAADNQNYYPEYVVNQYTGQDNDDFLFLMPPCDSRLGIVCQPTNVNHMFGLDAITKWDPYYGTTMPCGYTTREVDPSSGNPPEPCADVESWSSYPGYQSLLVLASGIQMAGPHLTPESFGQGLMKAQFENPNCDGPPLYQSCVSFTPEDHTMADSYVEMWASSHDHLDDQSVQFNDTFCYGDALTPHGPRYRLSRPGQVPGKPYPTTRPQFFVGACH
jgi:hypothetical protein